MSKISKKLLSLVIVLAMVLSMTPVISLPAAAETFTDATAIATQKAKIAQWEATYGSMFSTADGVTAPCPFCGEEEVTWVGGAGVSMNNTNGTHYYLYSEEDNTWTYASQAVINSSNALTAACVYLNNQNITVNGRIRIRAGVVNIFGNATFTRQNNDKTADSGATKYAPWALIDVDDRNATVNIWGGEYISQMAYQASGNNPYGSSVIRLTKDSYSNKQVNIYDGIFRLDTGAQGAAVEMAVGEINMYGGTISGGTGYAVGSFTTTDEATGDTVTHTGFNGGNVYMNASDSGKPCVFNMHGGSIYGGTATLVTHDIPDLDTDGNQKVDTDGNPKYKEEVFGGQGGNVYLGTSATFNMYGGSVYNGQSLPLDHGSTRGGNIMLEQTSSKLTMSGTAEIYGGQARNGGNVMVRKSAQVEMSGTSKVYNGVASTGPNIYLMKGTKPKLTMSGYATVYGGQKPDEEPSNIRLYGGTLVMKDNATVRGGATDGSAISVMFNQNPLIVLMDNATVKNAEGESKNLISDGRILITEGWAGEAYAALIDYDANPDRGYTCGEQIPVEKALIGTYNEETGEVTAADVAFTGKLYVSSNKAEALVDTTVTGGIVLAEEPAAAGPEFGVFDPASFDGMAYCEACYKQALAAGQSDAAAKEAALVSWIVYDETMDQANTYLSGFQTYYTNVYGSADVLQNQHPHIYLANHFVADGARFLGVIKAELTVCLNLNGYNVTMDQTADVDEVFRAETGATLNIMDTVGTSVVTGVNCGGIGRGTTLYVRDGEMNIYGGTYRTVAGGFPVASVHDNSTLNLYGGVIDGRLYDKTDITKLAENQNASRSGRAVSLWGDSTDKTATFNMYNGTIYGGTLKSALTSYEGAAAVQVGFGTHGYARFNMYNGTIYGGSNNDTNSGGDYPGLNSGAVSVHANATMEMSNGTIQGGAAKEIGNVVVAGVFKMSGGHIFGGQSEGNYDNVCATKGGTIILSGNAVVTGNGAAYSAVMANGTGENASKIVLKDNATVKCDEAGNLNVGVLGVAHSRTDTPSTIVVDPSWTGTACAYLYRYYLNESEEWKTTGHTNGDNIELATVTLGAYNEESGVITPSNEINGNLYAMRATRPIYVNAQGALYIPGYTVETATGRTWKATFAEALANYQASDAAYIGVWTDGELVLTEDAYVALMNGAETTVNGAYKLYAMDTTQDDYAGTAYSWTVAEETEIVRDLINPVNGFRYLNITTAKGEGSETIASTRLNLALNTVTLRAGKTSEGMGLYYKAKLSMSQALADKVSTYGVVLSLKDMPKADFVDEGVENGFTALETKNNPIGVNAENAYTVTLNSGSVFGIMKTDKDGETNAARGEMPIYANAYLEIDLDGDGNFEYIMADTDEDTANDVAWSMYDVLYYIDNRWSDFAAAQQKVTEFYSFWYEYGMNKWTFNNIKKA